MTESEKVDQPVVANDVDSTAETNDDKKVLIFLHCKDKKKYFKVLIYVVYKIIKYLKKTTPPEYF